MGTIFSPKHALNLMQNCDLPPPLKRFSGPDDTHVSFIRGTYRPGQGKEGEAKMQLDMHKDSRIDKSEILKALRRSQTRARQAEILHKEKDTISKLLVDESMQLFGYRQLVKLLELQLFQLQEIRGREDDKSYSVESKGDDCKWCAAAAAVFCLAVAGMGFAVGCTYLL